MGYQVQRVIDQFYRLNGPLTENSARVVTVTNLPDDTYHVLVLTALSFEFKGAPIVPKFDINVPGFKVSGNQIIEIYLSQNGVKLLDLANSLKPGENTAAIIFLEIGKDKLSNQVFEIALNPTKSNGDFLSEISHIKGILRGALRVNYSEFDNLVKSRLEGSNSIIDDFENFLLEKTGEVLVALESPLNQLASIVIDYKMPRELWHPTERPSEFNESLNKIAKEVDILVDSALLKINEIPNLSLSSYLKDITGESLLPDFLLILLNKFRALISEIENMWNRLLDFFRNIADFVKENKPDINDSFNTLIGYLSGVWDGIVDAVSGFIESIGLILSLVGKFLKTAQSPRLLIQLVLEALDQIIEAYNRIDWLEIWGHFTKNTLPELIGLLKKWGDKLVDDATKNSAAVGYYFGYLVYNIAELFFPPLSFKKVSTVSNSATDTAKFINQIISE